MNRFENVDVLAALEQLMRQNTAFYRNDFEIDKEIIGRAAASDKAEDRTLLWMSRPSGTHSFRESDVYLQGTPQHNTSDSIRVYFNRQRQNYRRNIRSRTK